MHKDDLGFLEPIFVHNRMEDFSIIIVNQTTKEKLLTSTQTNIKVINSFERGSPASRNLAIRNATADVCLMSDDDIVYEPNFKQIVEEAYQDYPEADMISFEANNEEGQLYTNYFPEGMHNKASLMKIFTWVISFKREIYKENEIYFNHHFGVGSTFKGATEYVFLRNAFDIGLNMRHLSKTIVTHPNISSGVLMGSDNAFFAKTAMQQRFIGNLSYIWLAKYVMYMWKDNYIEFKEIPKKFKIGLHGIKAYKTLKKTGEINKIYGI
ncbi:hypothetical protein A9Q87_13655 [Flavobacteriales bacterium 34_180_T64]|nr:hypothetical protein A9Q87_13655 [Flavobacteriales bacterium 34_180_T64]